jgi:hypothetical protein
VLQGSDARASVVSHLTQAGTFDQLSVHNQEIRQLADGTLATLAWDWALDRSASFCVVLLCSGLFCVVFFRLSLLLLSIVVMPGSQADQYLSGSRAGALSNTPCVLCSITVAELDTVGACCRSLETWQLHLVVNGDYPYTPRHLQARAAKRETPTRSSRSAPASR